MKGRAMNPRNSLLIAIFLGTMTATASADCTATATMGQPTTSGSLSFHIYSTNGGLDIPASPIPITLPCTPEEKALKVYNALKPKIDASNVAEISISGATVTITKAGGGGLKVDTITDTTTEPTKVQFKADPGNSDWWLWKLFRMLLSSRSQVVLPAGVSATIGFDSPTGFATEPIQSDGVHTLEQLEDDLSARMALHGLTFTKTFVTDPVNGDYILYSSQGIPSTIPTQTPMTYEVDTSQEWSGNFDTIGLEIDPQPIGTPYCSGDGSTPAPCPCGNFGVPGHGCNNSSNSGGAQLYATGIVAQDTVVMNSVGELPNALSILLQGDANQAQGVPFGDGVRCVGGHLKRIAVNHAANGYDYYPHSGDPSIRQRSMQLGDTIPPGGVRFYQVYYRDPQLSFCPQPMGDSWNVSNAVALVWQ
jgi:hypothetical protein